MSVFGSIVMSDEKKEQCNQINQTAQKLYELITEIDTPTEDHTISAQSYRYVALAKDMLEASVMWACKAISRS